MFMRKVEPAKASALNPANYLTQQIVNHLIYIQNAIFK